MPIADPQMRVRNTVDALSQEDARRFHRRLRATAGAGAGRSE
jgi:hypothetical protein